MEEQSKVVAILSDGKHVDKLNEGEEGIIVLDKTPFSFRKRWTDR